MRPAAVLATVVVVVLSCACQAAGAGGRATVGCGSTFKLQHQGTKFRLHSHDVAYGGGSGQQSVTGYPDADDPNSLWVLKGTAKEPCAQGDLIKNKQRVRIMHLATQKWLHSHAITSPISNNQEVSCFGTEEQTDEGDVWVVELEGGREAWEVDAPVRLMHSQTQAYLFTHEKKFGRPIQGQQEVAAQKAKISLGLWTAAEGIYFPTRTK